MTTCQELESKISCLVDLHLEGEDLLETIDHVLECRRCQAFYQKARSLDKRLGEVRGHNPETAMSPQIWHRIRRASGWPSPRFSFGSTRFLWAGIMAATLLVGSLGLWALTAFHRATMQLPEQIDVVLEGQPDKMTDTRFVLMTKELLEADRKYQYKMLEIMRDFAVPRGEVRDWEGPRSPEQNRVETPEESSPPAEMS